MIEDEEIIVEDSEDNKGKGGQGNSSLSPQLAEFVAANPIPSALIEDALDKLKKLKKPLSLQV